MTAKHRLETSVLVYLVFDESVGRWLVDTPTTDGHPLDAARDTFVDDSECECDDPEGHEAALDRAHSTRLPTASEVVGMLKEAGVG